MSLARRLRRALGRMSPEAASRMIAALEPDQRRALAKDWEIFAHDAQVPPDADWTTWLLLGGRGGGKTRAGAEWLADQATAAGRLALVGPSLHDVREVMVDGPSGLRALPRYAGGGRPRWEASRRRLIWPNGALA